MQPAIIIIGIGEMAGVFARGFLRAGHPVIPVIRDMNMHELAAEHPKPALVLIAVAEAELHSVLEGIPVQWRNHIALLQNELLPRDWHRHGLERPTVISVWFEKKKGHDFKVILPSPIFGPEAELLASALIAMTIPVSVIPQEAAFLYELVRKNLFILTTNIAGLVVGGNVEQLWHEHEDLARQVGNEIIALQEWLTGINLDREWLFKAMLEAFNGDPAHQCMGRTAAARLERALQLSATANIATPCLQSIHHQTIQTS